MWEGGRQKWKPRPLACPGTVGRAKRSQHHSIYFVPMSGHISLFPRVGSPFPSVGSGVWLPPLAVLVERVDIPLLVGVLSPDTRTGVVFIEAPPLIFTAGNDTTRQVS